MNLDEMQIVRLAKDGAAAAEIAESLGLELPAVEYVLARAGQIASDEVSDEDFNIIQKRMIDIAKHTEDDNLASRVGMFLWERKKGAVKDLRNAPQVNIGALNQLILSAGGFVNEFRKSAEGDKGRSPADVPPTVNGAA